MTKNNEIINTNYDFTNLNLYFENFKKKQERDYLKNKNHYIEKPFNPFLELCISLSMCLLIIIVSFITSNSDFTKEFAGALSIENSSLEIYQFLSSILAIFGGLGIIISFAKFLGNIHQRSISVLEEYTDKEYFDNNFEKYLKELSSYFKTNITENNIIKNDKGLIIEPNLSTNKDKYFWNKINEEKEAS